MIQKFWSARDQNHFDTRLETHMILGALSNMLPHRRLSHWPKVENIYQGNLSSRHLIVTWKNLWLFLPNSILPVGQMFENLEQLLSPYGCAMILLNHLANWLSLSILQVLRLEPLLCLNLKLNMNDEQESICAIIYMICCKLI